MAFVSLSACAKETTDASVYAASDCRRIEIVDAAAGDAVVGAEDLAFDAAERRVLISAYDRRTVEREAKDNAEGLSEGGIYAAPLGELADSPSLTLASLVSREDIKGGLRPHGLSFNPVRREIVFINRAYEKSDGAWAMTPHLVRVDADGAATSGDAIPCSANDVATVGGETIISFDHASCGWRGAVENVLNAKASGIASAEGETLFDGARFANGVVAVSADEVALAATRGRKILVLDAGSFDVARAIPLSGAPDNLTISEGGAIIAALHPSLLKIGLSRRLGAGKSGSRIVRVDTETGETTLLFDDPKGEMFSAATAAIEEDGILVAGSVVESGLLVCKR